MIRTKLPAILGAGLAVAMLLAVVAACSPPTSAGSGDVAVSSVTLDASTLSLTVNDTRTLVASISPSNATNKNVTWSSNATTFATVDPLTGKVTGVKAGNATITVTTADGSKTATCAVTVNPAPVPVDSVSLDVSTLNLAVGATRTLVPTISPVGATNKNVTWLSNATTVATVDSLTGKVTGVKAGNATITVTTADGSKTATCAVTVEALPAGFDVEAETGTVAGGATIKNDSSTSNASGGAYVGDLGQSRTLTLTATAPEAGTYIMSLQYFGGDSSRVFYVGVNGGTPVPTATVQNTGSWDPPTAGSFPYTLSIPVTLTAGANTLVFTNDGTNWCPNLDKLHFTKAAFTGVFQILGRQSGKAIGHVAAATSGSKLEIRTYADDSQRWTIGYNGDGTFTFTNVASRLCLDYSGSDIIEATASIGDSQKWYFWDEGNGYVQIVNKGGNDKAIAVNGADTGEGASMVTASFNHSSSSSKNDQWIIALP